MQLSLEGNEKPALIVIDDFFSKLIPFYDWFFILKAISIVIVLTIFEYHRLISMEPDFARNYPNLRAKLNKKTFNKMKWAFALIPFFDFYFYFLILKNKYTTVAFLKEFAIKKKLF